MGKKIPDSLSPEGKTQLLGRGGLIGGGGGPQFTRGRHTETYQANYPNARRSVPKRGTRKPKRKINVGSGAQQGDGGFLIVRKGVWEGQEMRQKRGPVTGTRETLTLLPTKGPDIGISGAIPRPERSENQKGGGIKRKRSKENVFE